MRTIESRETTFSDFAGFQGTRSQINQSIFYFFFRKVKGFELEEKLVYQIIEEAGNKGDS